MSISLIKLIDRYNIAKKFNFKISLDDIELTDDVIRFIQINDLTINKAKTELKFTDEYKYIHIINGEKLQIALKQQYDSSLLKHKPNTYRFLKNDIIDFTNNLVENYAGAYFNNTKYIWINLKGIGRYKKTSSIEKRVCLTISHEFIHHLLRKIDSKTSNMFDNIAKRLRNEGYGV